jgi:hypothetical protein
MLDSTQERWGVGGIDGRSDKGAIHLILGPWFRQLAADIGVDAT